MTENKENDTEVPKDGAEVDYQQWLNDKEREKLMRTTKENIINQLAMERKTHNTKVDDLKKEGTDKDGQITALNKDLDGLRIQCTTKDNQITKLNQDLDAERQVSKASDDKVTNLASQVLKAQNDLALEKDISTKLMTKLDEASQSCSSSDPKPTVLFITEEDHVFKHLDGQKVNWVYYNINGLADLETKLDDKNLVREIKQSDLVLIMLGKCDLIASNDGVALVFTVNRIINKLSENGVPFRMVQMLPVKGAKYRPDYTLYNRRLEAKSEGNTIVIMKLFDNLSENDIFVRGKITIQEVLLKRVAEEIQAKVGIPEISEKTNDDSIDTDGDDDDELTEFVEVMRKHSGAIIGKDGETVQELQKKTGAKITVIRYRYKDSDKAGALITGDKNIRLKGKIEIAKVIQQKEAENKVESDKHKQLKRNKENDKPWNTKKPKK